ncbi:hypothetical protein WA158_001930 [Blastocystis sp. Blastoise]
MDQKVLLLGNCGAGKTSMRSIIFANYGSRDTHLLSPTFDVDHAQVQFLGNMTLNIWDCGGQDKFLQETFTKRSQEVFTGVALLIFVFDVNSQQVDTEWNIFKTSLDLLHQYSPSSQIFILVHKMDLVQGSKTEKLEIYKTYISRYIPLDSVKIFGTSIWDETLYEAWSCVVQSLIPDMKLLKNELSLLKTYCEAEEVILFEKTTFLVLTYCTSTANLDNYRFEKISNIIKQFKLECSHSHSNFEGMTIKSNNTLIHMSTYTKNTTIMFICNSKKTNETFISYNVKESCQRVDDEVQSNKNIIHLY